VYSLNGLSRRYTKCYFTWKAYW